MSEIALYSQGQERILGYYTIEELTAEHRCGDIKFYFDETRRGKRRHEPTHAERVFTDARKLTSCQLPIAQGNRTVYLEHPDGLDAAPVRWWSHKPLYQGALA